MEDIKTPRTIVKLKINNQYLSAVKVLENTLEIDIKCALNNERFMLLTKEVKHYKEEKSNRYWDYRLSKYSHSTFEKEYFNINDIHSFKQIKQ